MEHDNILSQEDDFIAQFHQENSNLEIEPSFDLENNDDNDDNCDEVLLQHMDISEPLSTLRNLLEQRLGVDLTDYTFILQGRQALESHKNLVSLCNEEHLCDDGRGLVQFNVQIMTSQQKINIQDVLKTDDESPGFESNNDSSVHFEPPAENRQWTKDQQFVNDMDRLKIPLNPYEWSSTHVRHWLQWAARQFPSVSLKLADWSLTGSELCNLSHEEFRKKVPLDPHNYFQTHWEILKKERVVAVLAMNIPFLANQVLKTPVKEKAEKSPKPSHQGQQICMTAVPMNMSCSSSPVRGANSGQVQLWQFLLELLTDREHRDSIEWVGVLGEFKLIQPEEVARLWGLRKNKRAMNYEKLSRALRYYYQGDMISKVPNKRFTYKFECDLQSILGYSAGELKRLVEEGGRYTWYPE